MQYTGYLDSRTVLVANLIAYVYEKLIFKTEFISWLKHFHYLAYCYIKQPAVLKYEYNDLIIRLFLKSTTKCFL